MFLGSNILLQGSRQRNNLVVWLLKKKWFIEKHRCMINYWCRCGHVANQLTLHIRRGNGFSCTGFVCLFFIFNLVEQQGRSLYSVCLIVKASVRMLYAYSFKPNIWFHVISSCDFILWFNGVTLFLAWWWWVVCSDWM